MTGPLLAITTGSISAAHDLRVRLDDVPALRDRSNVVVESTRPGRQGGVTDVLMVSLGSGGVVTVLAAAVMRWMSARERPHPLTITITDDGRKHRVEVTVDQTTDSAVLAERILLMIAELDQQRGHRPHDNHGRNDRPTS